MNPDTDFSVGDRNALLLGGLIMFITIIVTTYTLASDFGPH